MADTWTPDVEDIVGAHFTQTGSIEFFKMYARNMTDKTFETTTAYAEYLNWFRSYNTEDLRNIVQVVDHNMVWLTPENELFLSTGNVQYDLGAIGGDGTFLLREDKILFGSGTAGMVKNLSGATVVELDFTPTDILGDVIVGENASGQVVYRNTTSGKQMVLGAGTNARVSDDRHVYWKGSDGRLYQATMYLTAAMDTADGVPVKIATSPRVYVQNGDTIAYIPNEDVYHSWYESFANVVTISESQMAGYTPIADIGFKPGALVRVDGGSKIYVVGSDNELHWLVSSEVANDLFGRNWPNTVLMVSSGDVLNYPYGASITTANDMAKTVMAATTK